MNWTVDDRRQLDERGISADEARRQVELLSSPQHCVALIRPCTPGDGIVRLGEEEIRKLHSLHAEAARDGRIVKFVPASGAASRMFDALLHFRQGPGSDVPWKAIVRRARDGQAAAAELVTFVEQIRRFAFHDDLRTCLRERGRDLDALAASGAFGPIVDALLDPDGLDYEGRPKGLLKFHRYPGGSRTAFEEHLVQAADDARDAQGVCRLHFTVPPRFLEEFRATARRTEERRIAGDARFEIGYSVQRPSTDTLCLDDRGALMRDDSGRLKFRPGGHGALIGNLNDLEGDLVLVRNIDNIQPQGAAALCSHWRRALAGYAVQLQREVFRHLEALSGPEPAPERIARARAFSRERLHIDTDPASPDQARDAITRLVSKLNRPLRVCGVVRNTGEPGGGPFWARDAAGGVSPQIVETAQVDPRDPAQQKILRSSTHFNPVDIVCAARDRYGKPFDLARYVDPEAVIIARKVDAGRELRALERPGLWNGAMAGWNTAFVEVPIETFAPVKTLIDLLRPEHQPD